MPLHVREGLSRRSFLVIGGSAVGVLALAPSCAFDLGSRQQPVIVTLHAHEVGGFLLLESSAVSGELFAGNGTSGFLQWGATQNYSTEEWDDGFCRFPTFP